MLLCNRDFGVLAVDPGLTVGLAFSPKNSDSIATNSFNLRFAKHDFGYLSDVFRARLLDYVSLIQPDLIVIEKQFMRGASTYHLFGMEWDAHAIAQKKRIPRYGVRPLQVKTRLTGNGRATKADMIEAAKMICPAIENDHEADAVGLLLCGQDYFIRRQIDQ